jgi:hypothetical protein
VREAIQPVERCQIDVREAIADVLALIGTGILADGFWLAWAPPGFIFGRLFVFGLALLVSWSRSRSTLH